MRHEIKQTRALARFLVDIVQRQNGTAAKLLDYQYLVELPGRGPLLLDMAHTGWSMGAIEMLVLCRVEQPSIKGAVTHA
jgi:hypothetical protein